MRRKPPGKTATEKPPAAVSEELRPDTPALLDRTHVALRDLLVKNQIDEYDYFKALIALASRWIVLEMNEDAAQLICELSPGYIEFGMPFQMVEDENFRVVAHSVAQVLHAHSPNMSNDDVAYAILLTSKPKAQA